MYARTNERGSRTNYVRSSIPLLLSASHSCMTSHNVSLGSRGKRQGSCLRGSYLTEWEVPEYKRGVFLQLWHYASRRKNWKLKQLHYKPGQAQTFPRVWDSQISGQSAHEGGKVISPTYRPPLPPQGNIPGNHFCYRLSRPQGHSAAGRFMSMNNSNYNIRNRTRNLPTCSAVPQSTATPAACLHKIWNPYEMSRRSLDSPYRDLCKG